MNTSETSLPNPLSNHRIYTKLGPNPEGLHQLIRLQKSLPAQKGGSIVPQKQLHLTLIHFGKVQDVFRTINKFNDISIEQYDESLREYIKESEAAIPAQSFTLTPKSLARFGERGKTLAVEYAATDSLLSAHSSQRRILHNFLRQCGIADVESFIKSDPNFMHVDTLRPHISIYKGFTGKLPEVELGDITLHTVPTVYPRGN